MPYTRAVWQGEELQGVHLLINNQAEGLMEC
jgi:hypothetical protein